MKKSLLFFYIFLITILLVNFKSHAKEYITFCPPDAGFVSNDNIQNYCVICEGKKSYALFKETEPAPDIPQDISIEDEVIEKLNPEKDLNGVLFCDAGDVIHVVMDINWVEDSETPEEDAGENSGIENKENVKGEDSNQLDPFDQLQKDLDSIIDIYKSHCAECSEIERFPNSKVRDFDNQFDQLFINNTARNQDRKSFVDEYFGMHLTGIETIYSDSELIDIYGNRIQNIKFYNKSYYDARDIYNKRLFNCDVGGDGDNSGYPCSNFLNTKPNDENFEIAKKFLKEKFGYLNDEKPSVLIAKTLVSKLGEKKQILEDKKMVVKDPPEEPPGETAEELPIEEIMKIQRSLFTLGIYKGKIDGDYGTKTKDAVTIWRNIFEFPDNEELYNTPDQYEKLQQHEENNKKRKTIVTKKFIKEIQQALNILGYNDGVLKKVLDIIWSNSNLKLNIKKWQGINGYEKTGSFFNEDDSYNKDQHDKLIIQYKEKKTKIEKVKSTIPEIQKYLKVLGIYKGGIDGDLGIQTKDAIRIWEDRNDTTLFIKDDEIDDGVLTLLRTQHKTFKELMNNYAGKLDSVLKNFKTLKTDEWDPSINKIHPLITSSEKLISIDTEELYDFKSEEFKKDETQLIEKKDYFEGQIQKHEDNRNKLDGIIDEIKRLKGELEDINEQYSKIINDINAEDNDYFETEIFKGRKKSIDFDEITSTYSTNEPIIENHKTEKIDKTIVRLKEKIEEINLLLEKPIWPIIVGGILLVLLLGGGGIAWQVAQKNKRKKDEEAAELEIQQRKERLEKEYLEKENINLKKNIDQQVQEKIIEQKTLEEKEKTLTPEQQKKKDIEDQINEYFAALKDVSFVDDFQSRWEAIGLKEMQILETSKARTLSIDAKTFSKCNFWAIPHKDNYIIYAGRTLRSNVAALTADSNRWAKELFSGIYEIVPGDDFFTKNWAVAEREGDLFTIKTMGKVQIPMRSN